MKQPDEMHPGSRYWKPSAKARTLRDLARAKIALDAVCRRCNHRRVLLPHELAAKVGAEFPVDQLPQRLRCTDCQSLGWVTLHESVRD